MDLDADESARMFAYVRGTVPAARDQSNLDLLNPVNGFPGVLYRWTSAYQREHMASLSDLRSVAKGAQEYRFSESGRSKAHGHPDSPAATAHELCLVFD
jgi:hypothetical protein